MSGRTGSHDGMLWYLPPRSGTTVSKSALAHPKTTVGANIEALNRKIAKLENRLRFICDLAGFDHYPHGMEQVGPRAGEYLNRCDVSQLCEIKDLL